MNRPRPLPSLAPAQPPRWRGIAIAAVAVALFAAAAFGVWSLHSTKSGPQPVAVQGDGGPAAGKAGAETARKVEAAK